jgi:hypothetical protein
MSNMYSSPQHMLLSQSPYSATPEETVTSHHTKHEALIHHVTERDGKPLADLPAQHTPNQSEVCKLRGELLFSAGGDTIR